MLLSRVQFKQAGTVKRKGYRSHRNKKKNETVNKWCSYTSDCKRNNIEKESNVTAKPLTSAHREAYSSSIVAIASTESSYPYP